MSASSRKETHRKLNVLADYLETVPAQRFNMKRWFSAGEFDCTVLLPADAPANCGTSACVGGWATTIKEFQDAGLRLNARGCIYLKGMPSYAGCIMSVLEYFFGLAEDEVEEIFFSGFNDTLAEKVECIRRIAADYA